MFLLNLISLRQLVKVVLENYLKVHFVPGINCLSPQIGVNWDNEGLSIICFCAACQTVNVFLKKASMVDFNSSLTQPAVVLYGNSIMLKSAGQPFSSHRASIIT